jgi:hypothetical protein
MFAPAPCPVPSAHRRLMDCHVHWHASADAYMEPETFRLNLNALIQSLRNVTFLLQSQKRDLPSFDTWYGAWQRSVKDDLVMRWVVNARNRIVKQSDLELHSKALIRLSFDWLNEVEDLLEVPPHFTTHQTISGLLSAGPQITEGVITIERRWVDVELPTRELMEASRYAYGRLARVVRLAHDNAGVTSCDLAARIPECVDSGLKESLQCMHQIDDNRRLHVDLSTMTQFTEGVEVLDQDDIPREVTRARYGEMSVSGDAIARVPQVAEMTKRMLRVDKELATVAWLFRGPQAITIFAIPVPNQRAKAVQMNRLADLVEQLNADGVVFICESWLDVADANLVVGDRDMKVAHPSAERGECIWIVGITKDGRSVESITVFMHKEDGDTVFGPTTVNPCDPPNMLIPVIRRWQQVEPRNSG